MPLLEKLKEIQKVKLDYKELQRRLYNELKNRFPYIMDKDIASKVNELEKELHLLLCSSLKYKSVKIPLPANFVRGASIGATSLNVQRGEPGFYFPNSHRGVSDIYYFRLAQYLDDNEDIWVKFDHKHSNDSIEKVNTFMIGLSHLRDPKNSRLVLPEKLENYFRILKEVMAYRPKFLCYVTEGYSFGQGSEFYVNDLRFQMLPKSFNVLHGKEEGKHSYGNLYKKDVYGTFYPGFRSGHDYSPHSFNYSPGDFDAFRLADYSLSSAEFHGSVHKRLTMFIENYPAIKLKLEEEEEKKKKAYNKCKDFLDQIKIQTTPFKVLNVLKK